MEPKDALRVTAVYVTGIFVIAVGFLGILNGDSQTGILIMIVGLLVSALGGLYGRKQFVHLRRHVKLCDTGAVISHLTGRAFDEKDLTDTKTKKKKENMANELKEVLSKAKPAEKKIETKQEPKKEEAKKQEKIKKPKIKQKTVKYIECPVCMAENDVNAKFCDNCGSRLK